MTLSQVTQAERSAQGSEHNKNTQDSVEMQGLWNPGIREKAAAQLEEERRK